MKTFHMETTEIRFRFQTSPQDSFEANGQRFVRRWSPYPQRLQGSNLRNTAPILRAYKGSCHSRVCRKDNGTSRLYSGSDAARLLCAHQGCRQNAISGR